MTNDSLSPVFNEDNAEVLKQSIDKVAALCEVGWTCSEKFKELSNSAIFNYFSLIDDLIVIAKKELESILAHCSS